MWVFSKKFIRKALGTLPGQSASVNATEMDPVTGAFSAEMDPARQYTEEVCSQIRYKRVHPYIENELSAHIEDQKRSFVKRGLSEEQAIKKAVLEMGDAVIVGQQLDRTHRPKPEWSIIAILGVMLCMGALSQYYISVKAAEGGWAVNWAFSNYLEILPFGIALLLIVYFTDYTILGKYPKQIYIGIFIVCGVFCLFRGDIYAFYIVGNEDVIYLALLLLPAYGGILYGCRNGGYSSIIKCGIVVGLSMIVLGYENGLVLAIVMLGGLILTSAAIARGWFRVDKKKAFALVYIPTLLCLLGCFVIKLLRYGDKKDYFIEGIKGIFVTSQDTAYGFWILYARDIIKNAQFIGQGGPGTMVKGSMEDILPSWWADFSLTYLIYRWGLITAVIFLIIFVLLMVKMIRATVKQRNALGFIISLSVVIAIGIQCVLFFLTNLGICNLGLSRVITMPLPLIAMGRKSFLANMALIGLLLSAYRNMDIVRDAAVKY